VLVPGQATQQLATAPCPVAVDLRHYGVTGGTIHGISLTLNGVTAFNSRATRAAARSPRPMGALISGAALALNGALTGALAIDKGILTGTGGSMGGAASLNGGTVTVGNTSTLQGSGRIDASRPASDGPKIFLLVAVCIL